MASGRGYLGKISAIVSANTGDYVRKLDDSAKRTAAFARTIQSDLNKASRDASRSIDAILTPLQRFERAIQNAASARLKFRGIDVAVRTIEDLRRSLAALDSDQEKEFAVRVSGLRNITELKSVLTDIREEDIDLAVNVGGVEGLRRLRNEVQEVDGKQINIRTERTAAELDTLIAKFSRLSPDRIREIRIAVEARQLDAAILKERQLVSLAKEIAAPLSASVAQFDKLTLEVQAGFIPALSAAQNRVEAVRDRIEAGGQIGQRAFRRIADEVRQTTEAISRLAEAQRLVDSVGTGRTLRDTSPRQFDAFSRAAEQTRRSNELPALVAAQFGLGDRQQRVRAALEDVDALQARRASQEQELIAARKAKNSSLEVEIQRRLQLTIQYEAKKTAELDRQLGIQLRQIEAAEEFQGKSQLVAKGGFVPLSDLERQAKSIGPSPFVVAQDERQQRVDRLNQQLNQRFAEGLGGRVTATQVNDELDKLLTSVGKLGTANQLNLDPTIEELRDAILAGENLERQLDRITEAQKRVALAAQIEALPQGSDARRALQSQFDALSGSGQTGAPPPALAGDVKAATEQFAAFGRPIDDSVRRVGVLQGALNSVKGQIDQLPIPLQASFVPLLAKAEAELQRLKNSGSATADQIKNAADEVARLKTQVDATSKASAAFGGTFRQFSDNADFQGASGRLQFLRQELLKARGDTSKAEDAADRLAAAFQNAANTPGGFKQAAAQLNQIEREAVEAAAAVLKISPARLGERLKRAGDVSRGAFGNTGLAVQQAIFAVDDFFSVTGDLSQRIRAAGNNISQLGFIIGGTAGLITGVLVSALAQGAVALINWANAGVEGKDRTKALNDVLSEQQNIVDKLASSFANLGKSLSLTAFRGGARDAEEFRRQIQELRDEQQEQLRGGAASVDPTVLRERALQNARRRELEGTSNIGEAVLLQREIEQSRIRERAAATAAFERPALPPADIRRRIAEEVRSQSLRRSEDARLLLPPSGAFQPSGAQDALERQAPLDADRARQRFLDETAVPQTARDAENIVRRRIDELAARRRETSGFGSPLERRDIDSQAQANAQRLNALQRDRVVEESNAQVQVIEQIRAFGLAIQQSQEIVAEAIRLGEPNSIEFSRQLIAASQAVSQAEKEFRDAGRAVLDAIELPTGTDQERRDRDAAIAAAEARRETAREAVKAQQAQASPLERRAFDGLRSRSVDPQATLDAAIGRARENLDAAGAQSGALARRLRDLQFQRDSIAREADDARTSGDRRAALDRELAAVNENIRAVEASSLALRSFSDGLNRASQSAQANLQSAQQDADEARRRNIALDNPRTRADRDSAERALQAQRDAQRRAERDIQIERGRLEDRVRERGAALGINDPFARIADINQRLEGGGLGAAQREALLNERERLQAALQDIIAEFDDAAAAISSVEERVRQFEVSAAQGRELIATPGQRAGEELVRQLQAVRAAFEQSARLAGQPVDIAKRQQVENRLFQDQVAQIAPIRVEFAREVQNAILSGPSRAPLQASDASTAEGRRELDRLLRRDDPAVNANLAELQRVNGNLQTLIQVTRDNDAPVAE